MPNKAHGQSVSEYGIGISAVVLVALGALALLSQNLNGSFFSISSGMRNSQPSQSTFLGSTATVPRSSLQTSNGMISNSSDSSNVSMDVLTNPTEIAPFSVTGSAGTHGVYQSDITTDATGALGGAQEVLAISSQLKQLVSQLALDPNSDPQVISIITQMSNSAHTVGEAMSTTDMMTSINGLMTGRNTFESAYNSLTRYLQSHPGALSASNQTVITQAYGRVNSNADSWAISVDLGAPLSSTGSQVKQDANLICQNGGDTSQCLK